MRVPPPTSNRNPLGSHHQTSPGFSSFVLRKGLCFLSCSMFHDLVSHTKIEDRRPSGETSGPEKKKTGRAHGYPTLQIHTTTGFRRPHGPEMPNAKSRAQADSSQSPRLIEQEARKGGNFVLEQLAKLRQSRLPRFGVGGSRGQGEPQALCKELNPLVVPEEARWWYRR